MNRARLYGTKATGFLSALFLYLAAAVAGAYGPLSTETTSAASQSRAAAGGMDARDPRGAGHLRPSVSFESREFSAAVPQGDGGGKALLPPELKTLPEVFAEIGDAAAASAPTSVALPRAYAARAPPILS
jgi:hypothetical protein